MGRPDTLDGLSFAEIEQTTARLAGESATADADAVRRTAEAFEHRLRELAALALQIGGEAGAVLAAMLDELLGTALANGTARRGLRVTTGSSDPADPPRRMGDAWAGASARIGSAWSSVEEGFVESVAVMGDAWSGFMAGMNAGGIRPELGAGGSKLPRVNNHGADDDDYWATHRYGDVRHHYADRQKYLKEQAKGDSTTRIQGETSFTKESLEHPITGLAANPGGGAPAPHPTLVLLGARAYVLDGAAVAVWGVAVADGGFPYPAAAARGFGHAGLGAAGADLLDLAPVERFGGDQHLGLADRKPGANGFRPEG